MRVEMEMRRFDQIGFSFAANVVGEKNSVVRNSVSVSAMRGKIRNIGYLITKHAKSAGLRMRRRSAVFTEARWIASETTPMFPEYAVFGNIAESTDCRVAGTQTADRKGQIGSKREIQLTTPSRPAS